MIGHFELGGFSREARVPRASLGSVETVSQGAGVRECGIDNVRVGQTEHQLSHGDPRQKPGFPEESFVRGTFELKQLVQVLGIFGKPGENRLAFVDVAGGD